MRQLYPNHVQMVLSSEILKLTGRSDIVLHAELQLRKEMITESIFTLENRISKTKIEHKNLATNLEKVSLRFRVKAFGLTRYFEFSSTASSINFFNSIFQKFNLFNHSLSL